MKKTERTASERRFRGAGGREFVARFDGGELSSDGGCLLLAKLDDRLRLTERLSGCFRDHRDPVRIEHSARELVAQRVLGLALGYEDLNDHDELRRDPLLAAVVGKSDPTGADRSRARDRGKPLASSSTLNRLELSVPGEAGGDRYRRLELDQDAVDRLLVAFFIESYDEPPTSIVLDLDNTDIKLHGHQEGRFFHGYYDEYCYLPLYIFCGDHLLCARLKTADVDGAKGSDDELARIVGQIRQAWPETDILVRGDSGFCRDWLMSWCEANAVDFVFGVARNPRLEKKISKLMRKAAIASESNEGKPVALFTSFTWRTKTSWSRRRVVIAKAEHSKKGKNPRFIVTSLGPVSHEDAEPIYREVYCARGDMENRIKEQQLDLFADRASAQSLWANQVRLYLSGFAYVLLEALRRLGLYGTEMERAQCGTIRLKLLKIGAQIRVTARRIWVHLASACPRVELFLLLCRRLGAT